jgi:hypothetical protein
VSKGIYLIEMIGDNLMVTPLTKEKHKKIFFVNSYYIVDVIVDCAP